MFMLSMPLRSFMRSHLQICSIFFQKQFPQGQFYILDLERYLNVIQEKFGLRGVASRLIYGRPRAPLKSIRFWGNIMGLLDCLSQTGVE